MTDAGVMELSPCLFVSPEDALEAKGSWVDVGAASELDVEL